MEGAVSIRNADVKKISRVFVAEFNPYLRPFYLTGVYDMELFNKDLPKPLVNAIEIIQSTEAYIEELWEIEWEELTV